MWLVPEGHGSLLANNGQLWLVTASIGQAREATVGYGWPSLATGGQRLAMNVGCLAQAHILAIKC